MNGSANQRRDEWFLELQTTNVLNTLRFTAGTVFTRYELTRDGFEKTLMTNYLGHFLLTYLLLARLADSGDTQSACRVVHISSEAHRLIGNGDKESDVAWDDLNVVSMIVLSFCGPSTPAFSGLS